MESTSSAVSGTIITPQPLAQPRPAGLPWREKVGYALGDTASNFYWKTFEFFLLIFYTDVYGLSPAVAGTMFGVARIWDAAIDPLMGSIADRTRSRWGRFRPYLLWGIIPLVAAGGLTFTTPNLHGGAKIVYAYATYIFMMTAYTVINIPYGALMGVMTSNTQERTSLSSLRFIGGFGGGIILVSSMPFLVKFLGQGNVARGWQLSMLVWGALAAALFLVSFSWTRERVQPPRGQRPDLKRELGDLARNTPWMVMFLLGLITLTSFITRSQTTAYYFKYYVGNEALTGVFVSTAMLAVIAGIALTGPATRLVGGKRNLYMVLMALSGVLTLAFHAVPRTSTGLIIGLNALIAFVQGPNAPLVWAMYADTADYGEWKFRRRNTGLIFAAATMAQKGGAALAGITSGFLLAATGYVANAQQSAQSLRGILLMMNIVPGLLCLLAAGVTLVYRLDDATMRKIEQDLLARRAEASR
jgi:GPH family glycoside/pentoside/hexuronide:cation symporter